MTSSNGNFFPRYWPFVRGIHRSPVNSPHKGQWHGALMFSLICVWINGSINNRETGDLRRLRAHYDVILYGSELLHWHPVKPMIAPMLVNTTGGNGYNRLVPNHNLTQQSNVYLCMYHHFARYPCWWLTPTKVFSQKCFPWLCVWEGCIIIFCHLQSEPSVRANVLPPYTHTFFSLWVRMSSIGPFVFKRFKRFKSLLTAS